MKKILITGGAGFIGTNLALKFVKNSDSAVIVYDNLSRKGASNNIDFLLRQNFRNLEFIRGDIRDVRLLKTAVSGADCVFHLAAQVAVTTSVEEPVEDFEVNAMGTLYLLETCRKYAKDAFFLYASTNKVYGDLSGLKLKELKTRYVLADRTNGITEDEPLDFYSPYGCSKGSADQYVRDYHRIYGLKTVVFRQSCIYGPYQHGNADQGWVVHFINQAMAEKTITIYGDGKQVRDILYIDDLMDAYLRVLKNQNKCCGRIFNVGGGVRNSFSLLELIQYMEEILGKKIEVDFKSWRPGDQKVFISDNTNLKKATAWKPRITKQHGIKKLIEWIKENT